MSKEKLHSTSTGNPSVSIPQTGTPAKVYEVNATLKRRIMDLEMKHERIIEKIILSGLIGVAIGFLMGVLVFL